jgi:hypothetical protein
MIVARSVAVLSCLAILSVGPAALAQTPPPAAAPTAGAAAPAAGAMDKKAISKACSDQAEAQGLHGKARKKFRNKCKATGGKPS